MITPKQGHSDEVTKLDVSLLDSLIRRRLVNLLYAILCHMLSTPTVTNRSLPYGSIIIKILRHFHVPLTKPIYTEIRKLGKKIIFIPHHMLSTPIVTNWSLPYGSIITKILRYFHVPLTEPIYTETRKLGREIILRLDSIGDVGSGLRLYLLGMIILWQLLRMIEFLMMSFVRISCQPLD